MDDPKKTQTRREGLEIEAVEPISGQTQTVIISYRRIQALKKRCLGDIECAGSTVPLILKRPTAVFEGLCEDDDEPERGVGWRCYCGIPECDYDSDGTKLLPRKDRVFLVFLDIDQIAYNWAWVKCDENDEKLPINHNVRFKKRLI